MIEGRKEKEKDNHKDDLPALYPQFPQNSEAAALSYHDKDNVDALNAVQTGSDSPSHQSVKNFKNQSAIEIKKRRI